MIRIDTNDQGCMAVFVLALEDRHRAGLDCPRQVTLTLDPEDFDATTGPVEALRDRWPIVAAMLTGLTPMEASAEGVEVRRLDPTTYEWVVR